MKLGKLKMPSKKSKPMDDFSVMELEMEPNKDEGEDSDMAGELTGESEGETGREPSMEEESAEGEMGPDLASVSDEELMAELKKRGLSSRMEK